MGLDINFRKVKRTDLVYFRKVNFLVKFFGDRHPELANCCPIDVTKDDLLELKRRCEKVLDNPNEANIILPTQEGFFFGSTEYGDSYFNDVQEVLDAVNSMLDLHLKNDESIEFTIWY